MNDYFLGMDIGTNSVGIACTDEDYRLLRAKGKDLWAVRLFDEAETSAQRRSFRTARRRLQRRKQRIEWLQGLFAPFMSDPLFFLRLNNSQFTKEDKDARLVSDDSLFADEGYTDRNYHGEFPTIFHLRYELQENGSNDVRLYYLALHHIVKYRGHFLFEGQALDAVRNVSVLFETLNSILQEDESDEAFFDPGLADRFREICMEDIGLNEKKKKATELFRAKGAPRKEEAIKWMIGAKGNPAKFFSECPEEAKSFSFRDLNDESFEALREIYGELFPALEALRAISNCIVFEKMLNGCKNVSEAMIRIYEKHRSDLEKLKRFVRNHYGPETYGKIFRSVTEQNNYVHYIGYTISKSKKRKKVKKCKYDDLLKYLKKTLTQNGSACETTEGKEILQDVENGTFLPKILHADNGLFPHQVNLYELDKILSRMETDFPETREIAPKTRQIFLYKIPYYVGPLNGKAENKNHWVVKKQDVPVTPWNFDEVIDRAKSNEAFMRRMTNKCTYLHGKDVLPKCSVLFQKFNLLNQLNKLRINSKPISVQIKQDLYNDLFLTRKTVSNKTILSYLVQKGLLTKEEADRSTVTVGEKGELKASMSTYITMKKILDAEADDDPDMCEDIVLWHTLNQDKNIVENLILDKYGDKPIIKQNIKKLKGLTGISEFSPLSKEFLCGISGGADESTGEVYTVLNRLYETNMNLNEILFEPRYCFQDAIDRENGTEKTEVTYEDLEDLYVSPAVRRGIWQALKMADEYVSVMGKAPKKIFVEVTRKKEEKKQTISRKKRLEGLYKDAREIGELQAALNKRTEAELRQERLYLYFLQLGKCAYTGKPIDLGKLNSNLYDVDHILPRSFLKDDSIDNKVLCLREKNATKSDQYPLPDGFSDQRDFWETLRAKELMSEKKFNLLTRREPLNETDYNDFIQRQKTLTDQAAKAVAELLKKKFSQYGTKIVYSKASNVSDFKNEFNLVKCRETNDLHHARDAYLNIVVGNVFDVKFLTPESHFYKKGEELREYPLKNLFRNSLKGAWDQNGSLSLVKKTYAKTSMCVTRFSFIKKGMFYDETVLTANDPAISAPKKGKGVLSDPKYGGYTSLKTSYFTVVESTDKKGNRIKTIEPVPVLYDTAIQGDPEKLKAYFAETAKLLDPVVLYPQLPLKTLLKVDGTPAYLAGVTGQQLVLHNASEWFTDAKTDEYVNALGKYVNLIRSDGELAERDCFIAKTNRNGEVKLRIDKEQNLALYDKAIKQLEKPIYGGISAFSSFVTTLNNLRDAFISSPLPEQSRTLLEICKFLKCDPQTADLSAIGGAPRSGTIKINKDIKQKKIQVVYLSPCGLTTRTITL